MQRIENGILLDTDGADFLAEQKKQGMMHRLYRQGEQHFLLVYNPVRDPKEGNLRTITLAAARSWGETLSVEDYIRAFGPVEEA